MKTSRRKSQKTLAALREKRASLWGIIEEDAPLVAGCVYDVQRRCGNPTCHCREKPSHLQTLLIYIENGIRRCKFVRQEDAQWVHQAGERYRKCKKTLKAIRAMQKKELQILMAKIKERCVPYE